MTYRAASRASDGALDRTARVMRARLAALGIRQGRVTRAGDRLRVTVPAAQRAAAAAVLGRRARLAFYDWEPNVLGPDGKPAPRDTRVTGGDAAGTAGVGSHPRRVAAVTARRAGGRAIVVRAEPPSGRRPTDQWFVLRDDAALTGADVVNARAGADPDTGRPIVAFRFTDGGRRRWHDVTRAIAQRGQAAQLPGTVSGQHFAVVLDDQLLSVPFIDYRTNPDGIDAVQGSQISGGFTPASARALAAMLRSGPLPVAVRRG